MMFNKNLDIPSNRGKKESVAINNFGLSIILLVLGMVCLL